MGDKMKFVYAVTEYDGLTTVFVSTKKHWDSSDFLQSEYTEREEKFLELKLESIDVLGAAESMYETELSIEETKRLISQFTEFEYSQTFQDFINN
jgi:hypothetical protein